MRIFLTGGAGMVGRNFLADVRAKDHEITAPTRRELDLTDAGATRRVLAGYRPDIVIHTAALVGGIQANINNPVRFLAENMAIGINVVLAARAAGVNRLINLGSSCMYPRDVEGFLQEDMLLTSGLEPTNEGYALAKIATARLCQYVEREDRSLRYKTFIPCNLYGPYDNFNLTTSHVLPAAIAKLADAKRSGTESVEIWGSGKARREFMFAADLVDCLYRAVDDYDAVPGIMNVGLGADLSIEDYYKTAAEVVGYTGRFTFDLSKPEGMRRKTMDVSRARAWGWQANTPLRSGIKTTLAYYLAAHAPTSMKTGPPLLTSPQGTQ